MAEEYIDTESLEEAVAKKAAEAPLAKAMAQYPEGRNLEEHNVAECPVCVNVSKQGRFDERYYYSAVAGAGSTPCDIMLIGEAPGEEEALKKSPFIGPAGQKLTECIEQAGLKRENLHITNVVPCRPWMNHTPTKREVQYALPFLIKQIQAVKPKVIVLLGGVALQAILNKSGITKLRGNLLSCKEFNCKVIPTFHPSYLLRNADDTALRDRVVKDLSMAKIVAETGTTGHTKIATDYQLIETPEAFQQLMANLSKAETVEFDLETTGLEVDKHRIICVGFSYAPATGFVVPIFVDGSEYWGDKQAWVLSELKKFFESDVPKCAHMGSFDMAFLKAIGINVKNYAYDTLVMHYLLDENARVHGLKDLALEFTDMGMYDAEVEEWKSKLVIEGEKTYAKKTVDFSKIPFGVLWPYAAADVDATGRLRRLFYPRIEQEALAPLFKKIVMPLHEVLCEIEWVGVKINLDRLKTLRQECESIVADIDSQLESHPITAKAKKFLELEEINYSSPVQLRKILFDILGLTPVKETKMGSASTDDDSLTKLADQHEIPRMIKQKRAYEHLLKAYGENFEAFIRKDGRIHAKFLIHGTEIGRLACVPLDAEILTKHGWARYDHLTIGEEVMGYDIQRRAYTWTHLRNIHVGRGELGRILVGRNYPQKYIKGLWCTANHNWIVRKGSVIGVSEAQNIPMTYETLLLPRVSMPESSDSIFSDFEAELAGWFLTDGYADPIRVKSPRYALAIQVVKRRSVDYLDNLLRGHPHTRHEYFINDGGCNRKRVSFRVSPTIFTPIYRKLYSCSPSELVMRMSHSARKQMFSAMLEGDGSMRRGKTRYDRFGGLEVQPKRTCEYFEILAASVGQPYSGRCHLTLRGRKPFISYNLWKRDLIAHKGFWKAERFGDVWCPETDCGTWVMRQGHHIALTGNSRNPNLQNIPRMEEDTTTGQTRIASRIRGIFVSEPGWSFAEADYCQIQYRIWANYAKDKQMLEDIKNGFDVHRWNASRVLDKPMETISKEERQHYGKGTTYSMMFGASAYKVSSVLGISKEKAQRVINDFFLRYPGAREYERRMIHMARVNGYVADIFGRRRRLPGILSSDFKIKSHAERNAVNTPIQQLEAEILYIAMIRLRRALKESNLQARLVLPIHDSLLTECPDGEVSTVVRAMHLRMLKEIPGIEVPIEVEFKVGKSLDQMTPLTKDALRDILNNKEE